MELQGEDLETFNRLRAKYAGADSGLLDPAFVDPNAPAAPRLHVAEASAIQAQDAAPVRVSSKLSTTDVRMCAVCQGAGLQREEYNHRVLERYCTFCQGRGVIVYKNGIEVKDSELSQQQQQEQQVEDDKRRSSDAAAAAAHAISDEQATQLQQDLDKLAAKLAAYQKEQEQLQVSLAQGDTAHGQEAALRQQLAAQLAVHIKKLRSVRARKEAQLLLAGREVPAHA